MCEANPLGPAQNHRNYPWLSANFELGFYVFMNYLPEHGFQVNGIYIRPRIVASTKWYLPVDLGLSAEIVYQVLNILPTLSV